MTAAAEILSLAESVGVHLRAQDGKIIAKPKSAVNDALLGLIRANKLEVLQALTGEKGAEQETQARRERVLAILNANPGVRYAIYCPKADSDPVVVAVALRRSASVISFDFEVPLSRYDGMALLELVEKWSAT